MEGSNEDKEEELAYVEPTGSTVIDNLVGNEDGCNIVEKIQVRHRTDSVHAMLEMKIEGEVRRE